MSTVIAWPLQHAASPEDTTCDELQRAHFTIQLTSRPYHSVKMDNSQEKKHPKDKNLLLISYLQAFPEAIDQCLKKGFVVGDCLKDVPICSDVANGPLTKSCAAQPENVTENTEEKFQFSLERAETTRCQVGSLCLVILGHQKPGGRAGRFTPAFLTLPPGRPKENFAIWHQERKAPKHLAQCEMKPRVRSKRTQHPHNHFFQINLRKKQQTTQGFHF